MSIEEQLKYQYKQHSKDLTCPPSIDSRIFAIYKAHISEKRGKKVMNRSLFLRRGVIFALVFVLLTGFAYGGTLLFQNEKGNISLSYIETKDFSLDQELLERLRASIKEIEVQLQPGETAVVYFAEIAKINERFKDWPLLTVVNPIVTEQEQEWNQELSKDNIHINLPNEVLGTFQFIGGKNELAFGAGIGQDQFHLKEELKAKSEETGESIVWVKIEKTTLPFSSYTTIYENENQDRLYYTVEVANEKIKIQGYTLDTSQHEEMNINGNEAFYVKNDQSLYGESNILQSIDWITTQGEKTFKHSLSTDSTNITKTQLVEAARRF